MALINLPQTLEECRKFNYGIFSARKEFIKYIEGRCAWLTWQSAYKGRQCKNKNDHGLYCSLHHKKARL